MAMTDRYRLDAAQLKTFCRLMDEAREHLSWTEISTRLGKERGWAHSARHRARHIARPGDLRSLTTLHGETIMARTSRRASDEEVRNYQRLARHLIRCNYTRTRVGEITGYKGTNPGAMIPKLLRNEVGVSREKYSNLERYVRQRYGAEQTERIMRGNEGAGEPTNAARQSTPPKTPPAPPPTREDRGTAGEASESEIPELLREILSELQALRSETKLNRETALKDQLLDMIAKLD